MKKTFLIMITSILILSLLISCSSKAPAVVSEDAEVVVATEAPSIPPAPTPVVKDIPSLIGQYQLEYCVDGEGNIVLDNRTFTANYTNQVKDNFSLQDNMRVYREEGAYPYYYGAWRFANDKVDIANEDENREFVVFGDGLKTVVPFSHLKDELLDGSKELITDPDDTYLVYQKVSDIEVPYDYNETDYIDSDGSWGYVSASSILNYSDAYETVNMFDKDLSTAWVEGVGGDGEGERIFIGVLESDYTVSGISLINGYTKSKALYDYNARLKTAKVIITTTTDVYEIDVAFEDGVLDYQTIEFGRVYKDVTSVEMIIGESYAGTKYKDLCISELKLIN
ncbi:MAG: hypothetical protein AB1Z19_03375 [Eubacteriales bacterium]